MVKKNTWVKCPTCRKPAEWSADNPFRPFCSGRCKLIDLGVWANEGYSVEMQEEEWQPGEPQVNRKH